MSEKKELIRFFLRYQRPHITLAIGAGVLLLIFVLLQLPTPLITRYLIDTVIPSGNFRLLHLFCLILFAVIVVKQLSSYLMRLLLIKYKARVQLGIEKAMYLHIQELPMSFFIKNRPGYILSRIGEISSADALLADTFMFFIKDLLTLGVGMVAILSLHLTIGLIALSTLPFFILSIILFHKKLKTMNQVLYEKSAAYMGNLEKNLNFIEKIKTSVKEEREGQRLVEKLLELVFTKIKSERLNAVSVLVSSSIAVFPPFAVIYFGVIEIMKGNLTLGTFIAINAFLANLFGPAKNLTEVGYSLSRALAGIERVYEIFNQPTEDDSGEPIEEIKEIQFKDVEFSYVNGGKVLDGLSFSIKPGEKVALVGKSGQGKSTIIKMILKLLVPTKGEVLISGKSILQIERKSLRRKVGVIAQSSIILDADVEEYEKNDKLKQALGMFNLNLKGKHAFKAELSGGEVQRLEVVNMLLQDAELLIIDEGTSNLDYESERYALRELLKKYKDKTVIVIAHRLNSISEFDRLMVLENGIICEEGTHDQLINKQGVYWNLWEKQKESVFQADVPLDKVIR